jgi:hypothetical protein
MPRRQSIEILSGLVVLISVRIAVVLVLKKQLLVSEIYGKGYRRYA